MLKFLLATVLMALFSVTTAHSMGTTEDFIFYSESLGEDRDARIYLPEGYDPEGVERYPVIYFLHGARYGYEIYWQYFGMKQSLDTMIELGEIQPLILVTPDGLVGPYDGSCWTNSSTGLLRSDPRIISYNCDDSMSSSLSIVAFFKPEILFRRKFKSSFESLMNLQTGMNRFGSRSARW